MNCQEVMIYMQRQLDGDLDSQEEDEMHAHLMDCLACAQMFERLQRLSDELSQLPKVTPPFSLVDAILPQIEEIDRAAVRNGGDAASLSSLSAPAAIRPAAEVPTPSRKPSWQQRYREQFSWKIAGGVVAAGLILGFFAFNMQHPVLDNADGLLPMKSNAESKQMSTDSSAASGLANDQAPKAQAAAGATSNAVPPTTEPAAQSSSAPTEGATTGGGAAADSSGSALQEKPDAKLEQPTTLVGPVNKGEAMAISPSPTAPERMKKPSETAPVAADKANSGAALSTPAATPSETPAPTSTADTQAPAPSAKDTEAQRKNSLAPNTGDSADRGFAPNAGLFSIAAANVLQSTSGIYAAAIEGRHVVIRNSAAHDVVFTSKLEWQPGDQIMLLEWSGDEKFFYQVQSQGGALQMLMIDLKEMKESVK